MLNKLRNIFLAVACMLQAGVAYADAKDIGGVASQVITSFSELAKLITAGAYIAGMGFAVGAILKFKAHKDNPTQIPVGTPIALLFIAAALISYHRFSAQQVKHYLAAVRKQVVSLVQLRSIRKWASYGTPIRISC